MLTPAVVIVITDSDTLRQYRYSMSVVSVSDRLGTRVYIFFIITFAILVGDPRKYTVILLIYK